MPTELLPAVVQQTDAKPRHAVIWLHGLGADGHDFVPIIPQLDLAGYAVRFVFPHAPIRPVTINGGLPMRAWYDFTRLDIGHGEATADIATSVEQVQALITAEVSAGIAPANIVLAGFSQGGVIALATGLGHRPPLGGIIALSTYLRPDYPLPEAVTDVPPIFMAHGRDDPIIALTHGEATAQRLRQHRLDLTWLTYPMGHSVGQEEIVALGRWLRAIWDGTS